MLDCDWSSDVCSSDLFDAELRDIMRIERATSDARGHAIFAHGRAQLAQAWPIKLALVVDGAFPTVVRREVSVDDVDTTVPIEVPPFGALEVAVHDFDDRELAKGAEVELVPLGLQPPFGADPPQALVGRARFPAVAVGVEARLEARILDGLERLGPILGSVTIPRAGETIAVVLGGPNSVPVLVGRALDPNGAPLARTTIDVQIVTPPSDLSARFPPRLVTDESGGMRILVPGWSAGGGVLRLVVAPTSERKILTALVTVADGLSIGEHPIGDVVLSGLPRLVDGFVVDQLGHGLENARVEVFQRSAGGEVWKGVGCGTVTGRWGKFSIDADPTGSELAITAVVKDCERRSPLTFQRGTRGIEIALERWASIDAKVPIDAGLEPQQFQLLWTVKDANGVETRCNLPGRRTRSHDGVERTWFQHTQLRAGRGTLAVQTRGMTLIELANFELLPGPNPEVLRGVDLRDCIRSFALHIVDQNGDDIANGQIHFRASGTEEPWRVTQFRRGRVEIVSLAAALDVSMFGPPGRMTHYERVRGGETLVMAGPLWTTLTAIGGNPVRAPHKLALAVELVEPHGPTVVPALVHELHLPFDAAGRAHIAFAVDGKYAARFEIASPKRAKSTRVGERFEFTVSPSDGEQAIEFALPREAIDDLCRELDEAPATGR
jgi:hypothetical protein